MKMTEQWQEVNREVDATTSRMPVLGGWIYRTWTPQGVALVFVPRTSRPYNPDDDESFPDEPADADSHYPDSNIDERRRRR